MKKNLNIALLLLLKKKSNNSTPKLNFNFDLIIKSGFKPDKSNNMKDINELLLYVKNNFINVK